MGQGAGIVGPAMSDATERETLIAVIGLSICGWIIAVVIAWSVWQMLDAGKAQCQTQEVRS